MRILILDDHPLFADAISEVLLPLANPADIHKADTISCALWLIDAGYEYDLILVDLNLPSLDGFAFIGMLQQRFIVSPIVVVSASQNAEKIRLAQQQGIMGYIHKSSNANTILQAVKQVLAGNLYFPDRFPVAEASIATSLRSTTVDKSISDRQLAVLQLMNEGLSNKAIAYKLNITESTVKIHVSKLFDALAVHNRIACLKEAHRTGLLTSIVNH